jgi:hypothetical protein
MGQQWLEFAPKPAPLAQGERWHVFISYRSVSRPWVLRLYDVLRQLGYDVFLDQYVLSAAAPLALSLSEALGTSRAAVMVWSSSFEDSEWCKAELNSLVTLELSRSGFRYVIAKVDSTPLPAIAAGKIFVDFSEQLDCPIGVGLLRMLYGLANQPLAPEAVRLAAEYDESVAAGQASVAAARTAGDVDRLKELAARTDLAWGSTPELKCEAAEALIALDELDAALAIVEPLMNEFPKAIRPKQLTGLVFARKKETLRAQQILGELHAAGQIDPETLGIYARTWFDRYKATGNRLLLLKSRDLYRQAFEASPKDYYAGINAASKSALLGERETAAQLAKRVEAIVGTSAVPDDYWRTATVAEVQLLQGNYVAAGALYTQAVATAPFEVGSHRSSRDQAILLLDAANASEDERGAVLAAFAFVPERA